MVGCGKFVASDWVGLETVSVKGAAIVDGSVMLPGVGVTLPVLRTGMVFTGCSTVRPVTGIPSSGNGVKFGSTVGVGPGVHVLNSNCAN